MAIPPIALSLVQPQTAQRSPRPTSTPLFVLRSDLKTATTDPDDPTEVAIDLGADTPGANSALHRLAVNPGAYFLDLFAMISGTVFTMTTRPKVRVFGFVPFEAGLGDTNNPYAFDTSNFSPADNASLALPVVKGGTPIQTTSNARGLWVPLRRPVDGMHEFEFSATFEVDKNGTTSSSKAHKLTDNAPDVDGNALPASVYTGNCTHVLALVSTALVGPTAGCLLGSFRS